MKAIIFDMDGVIIDTEKVYYELFVELFRGIDIPQEKFQTLIGANDQYVDRFIEAYYPGSKAKAYKKMNQLFNYREYDFSQILNMEVFYLIRDLFQKGYRLALASSSQKKIILKVLKDCALNDFFEFVISGEECENSKPSPEIYQKVLDYFKLDAQEVMIVEDSYYGIEAAKATGALCVAKKEDRFDIDQSKADYVFKDLRNIKTLLPPPGEIRCVLYKSKEHLKSLILRNKVNINIEDEKNRLIYSLYADNRMIATFVLKIQDELQIVEYKITEKEKYCMETMMRFLAETYQKNIRMCFESKYMELGFEKINNDMLWRVNCE